MQGKHYEGLDLLDQILAMKKTTYGKRRQQAKVSALENQRNARESICARMLLLLLHCTRDSCGSESTLHESESM